MIVLWFVSCFFVVSKFSCATKKVWWCRSLFKCSVFFLVLVCIIKTNCGEGGTQILLVINFFNLFYSSPVLPMLRRAVCRVLLNESS